MLKIDMKHHCISLSKVYCNFLAIIWGPNSKKYIFLLIMDIEPPKICIYFGTPNTMMLHTNFQHHWCCRCFNQLFLTIFNFKICMFFFKYIENPYILRNCLNFDSFQLDNEKRFLNPVKTG